MTLELETKEENIEAAPAAVPARAALAQLLFGKHVTYAISAVSRLRVSDHMSAEPSHVEELAGKTGAHASSLYRVMRFLAGVGVFNEAPGRRFSLTPMSDLLRTDAPGSLRYMATMFGDQWSVRAFGHISDCVRTGGDGITAAFGKQAFDLLADFPEDAETFHRAMTSYSAVEGPAVLEAYDFSGIRRLADVGGGHGMLLASILKQYPKMRGLLFDLPEVVSGAGPSGHFAACEDRVEIESGSFLERAPSDCDAYILKHIIHDWSDDHCRRILTLIREQLPPEGRVLLCEMIINEDPGPSPAKALDIEMLVMTPGGKERTITEFADLFASAGLRLTSVTPTNTPVCVLEARRA
jgi:hypothetical protein